MALCLDSLNIWRLRSESRKASLVRNLARCGVYLLPLKEGHLIATDYENILSNRFHLYSAYFDSRSRCLTAQQVLYGVVSSCVQTRICALDVALKGKTLRFIEVYALNDRAGWAEFFFRRVEPFSTTFRQVSLAVDLNAVFDPDVDHNGKRSGTNKWDVKSLRDFIERSALVDKFRNDYTEL